MNESSLAVTNNVGDDERELRACKPARIGGVIAAGRHAGGGQRAATPAYRPWSPEGCGLLRSALVLMPFSILRSMAKSPNSIRIRLNIASRGVDQR